MELRAGPVLRWVRALMLAAVAFSAGLVAHISAHGLLPGTTALVVLFGCCTVATACFLGSPASTRRVVLLLMGGQTFIHTGLTALAGHAGDPVRSASPHPVAVPVSHAVDRTGSLFDQYAAMTGPTANGGQLTVPFWMQHLIADMTGPHAAMAAAHLAAAAVVGLWLASGERAVWAVISLTSDTILAALSSLAMALRALWVSVRPLAPIRVQGAGWAECPPLMSRVLTGTVSRRGPPVVLRAV
jgi:hypothetical protein